MNKTKKKWKAKIKKAKPNAHHLINSKLMLPAALLVIIFAVLVLLKPAFIGYFALEEAEEHVKEVDKLFVENSSYLLIPEKEGELKSLVISGLLIMEGNARVYLETDNESYLVFDSNALEEKGIIGITGLAVSEFDEEQNETIGLNETEQLNETIGLNETEQLNETIGLNETEQLNETADETLVNETEEPDTSPPNPITSLQVVNKTGVVVLSWINPDDSDFAGVKALRKQEVFPDINYSKAITDSLVADVTGKINSPTTLLDDTVTANLTYYYRVYSYDNSFNYASGRGVLATVKGIELDKTENESISFNETMPINETIQINETIGLNETLSINETIEDIANPPENAEILIELEYNNGTEFDIDDDGIEARNGIVDFSIKNTEFNWAVNESNLCTRWETKSIDNGTSATVCYGSKRCCNFIGLEPLTSSWNEVFYSYYGRYGASSRNKINAQVVYVDYSISEENPYSYIYYSGWGSLNEVFLEEEEKITKFDDICIETCLLSLNETSYRLRVELENAALRLDNISYAVLALKVEEVNNAPELLMDIPDITITKNSEFLIDLSEYFFDKDNDSLDYNVYEMDNISVLVDNDIAELIPDYGFTGIRHSFIIANDSKQIAVSNVFKVNVTEALIVKNITVENVTIFNVSGIPTQLKAEINKPVKWIKIIYVENSEAINKTINVSFSVPDYAFNISVKDLGIDKTIEKDKIIVKDKTKIRAEIGEMDEKDVNKTSPENESTGLNKATALNESIKTNDEGILETKEKEFEFTDLFGANELKEYIVEYETSAPVAVEKKINSIRKQITISSGLHYTNVLAYTNITEITDKQGKIRLYWIRNGSRELFTNASYYDLNNNSLIDRIEWVIPSLSNQTFELEIEVLNIQSYPTVWGNWTVMFNTTGTANLTITAFNKTGYSEIYNDNISTIDDLEILELRCGDKVLFNKDGLANNKNLYFILDNSSFVKLNETIGKELRVKSLFAEDYYCNSTGYHTVKVLTPGEHNQEFRFNDQIVYAHNFATDLIKASTVYYEFNCPKCAEDYDSSPVNFCPMINHWQEMDDFEAELSFDIEYVEQVNSASICAYQGYSWYEEPFGYQEVINYIEKINSSQPSAAPARFSADDLWINETMSVALGWKCINITAFVQDSVENNETKLYARWWGQDINGSRGPVACFKGFAPLDECDGNNPSGALDCRPYLNIT